ncbi:DivIVA domain-containing protein [Micromonospora sp. NPDC049497]|uniref:DivIVA domain-containing protein n=1 Tax=Micromonospora sp. NPDC049497 TaxID=3364273 RepID=UPI0037BB8601
MRKPAKTATVLFGLGVGAVVGPSLGSAAVWSGVAVAALGVALSLVGTTGSDLAGDGVADRDEDAGVAGDGAPVESAVVAERRRRNRQRPTLSGLGTRVEQILKLAEEQANDHRNEARREADRMVTAARREAEAILHRAHEQVAEIAGTRQDQSPSADPPA